MPTGTSNSPLKQTGMQYSTSGTGKGYVDPRYQSPASGVDQKYDVDNTAAAVGLLSSAAGTGGSLIDASNNDALSEDYKNKAVASAALKGAGTGASIGGSIGSVIPVVGTGVGMLVGGAIGATAGGITGGKQADKDIKIAKSELEIAKINEAIQDESALVMTGKTKALTSIQGTIPYNKSANEHKSGLTMNKIAMSGISSKY
jgi:phage tail tape-measure protein